MSPDHPEAVEYAAAASALEADAGNGTPRIDGDTATQRFIVVLMDGEECELCREVCTVTADSAFIEDAVEEKVADVLSGWRIGIGDCVRVEAAS